ncbi:MAG: hypothetical protein HC921_12585 [Synechococcaceae cyanobacterium SM2_3_1]|nr:hypothetical protein [Synechococcaceae cyanobacterium SM2_3_1]
MKQDYMHLVRKVLLFGIGGYIVVSIISWLFTWLIVANSYCSYKPSKKECELPLFPLYPKWEYQTFLYAEGFREPILQSLSVGCMTEEPLSIKVMQYRQDSALVWYKGESGSTWLASFYRSPESLEWQMYSPIGNSEEKVCHVELIYGRFDGATPDSYYWYN